LNRAEYVAKELSCLKSYDTLLDDQRRRSCDSFRDVPMPGVRPRSASDVEFQSQLDDPATDPGVAAAIVACDALVKKNMASAKNLEQLMPVLRTLLHPDYLSTLGSSHVQIRAVVTTPPSSPASIMLGSQILNTRRDAQEIQARLVAARRSNKRERCHNDSTSGSGDEGPSRNLTPQLKKCRSNQRKRTSRQSSSSECESPNPQQHRRHQKTNNGSLSDGVQSQAHRPSQAHEDSEVQLLLSGFDCHQPSAPNPLQGAGSDIMHEQ